MLSGYVLPSLMHFGFGGGRPPGEVTAGDFRAAPTVLSYPGGAGLGWVGCSDAALFTIASPLLIG